MHLHSVRATEPSEADTSPPYSTRLTDDQYASLLRACRRARRRSRPQRRGKVAAADVTALLITIVAVIMFDPAKAVPAAAMLSALVRLTTMRLVRRDNQHEHRSTERRP